MNTEAPVIPIPAPEIHDDGSHDERIQAAANAHVNVVRVNLGGFTLMVIVFFGIIIAGCGIVMGLDIAERTSMQRAFENDQRAWRYAELKYDELNLVIRRAGIALPEDKAQGVGGNLESNSFKRKEH